MLDNHFVKVLIVLAVSFALLGLSYLFWGNEPQIEDPVIEEQGRIESVTEHAAVELPAVALPGSYAYIEGTGPDSPEDVADAILAFTESVKSGVERLVKERDLDPDLLEFSTGPQFNRPCAPSESCVFAGEGGGVDWKMPPEGAQMLEAVWWYYHPVDDVHVTDLGTEDPELVMVLVNVMPGVCRALNARLGIEGEPVASETVFNMFKGVKNQYLDAYPGKPAACWNLGGFGVHYFYYTLLEG